MKTETQPLVQTVPLDGQGFARLAHHLDRKKDGLIRSQAQLRFPAQDGQLRADGNFELASHGLLSVHGPLPNIYHDWVLQQSQSYKNESTHRFIDLLAAPLTLKDFAAWRLTHPAFWPEHDWPIVRALRQWAGASDGALDHRDSSQHRLTTYFHGQRTGQAIGTEGLERIIECATQHRCAIVPFVAQYRPIPTHHAAMLGSSSGLQQCVLGKTSHLGLRGLQRSAALEFRFVPMRIEQARALATPGSEKRRSLQTHLRHCLPAHAVPIVHVVVEPPPRPWYLQAGHHRLGIDTLLGKRIKPVHLRFNPYASTPPTHSVFEKTP